MPVPVKSTEPPVGAGGPASVLFTVRVTTRNRNVDLPAAPLAPDEVFSGASHSIESSIKSSVDSGSLTTEATPTVVHS